MFGFDPTHWLLVFVRISAMLAIFPLFSMQNFPVAMRVALSLLISLLLTPLVPALAAAPAGFIGLIGLMALETGFGLLLRFVSRLCFYVLELAGSLIAMEMGLNMAATFNPFSNARSEAPGLILFNLGAILFFTLNLHHHLLVALEPEALPRGVTLERQRQHAHAHEVRAVDALEGLGDDRAHAEQVGALGRPVA